MFVWTSFGSTLDSLLSSSTVVSARVSPAASKARDKCQRLIWLRQPRIDLLVVSGTVFVSTA